jgi:hypothetical protein
MGPVPRVAAFVATYADAYVWPQKGSIYCPLRALARFRRQSLRGAAFLGGGRAPGRAGQFEGPVPALRTDLTSALLGEAVRTASSALLAEELHRFVPSASEAVGEKLWLYWLRRFINFRSFGRPVAAGRISVRRVESPGGRTIVFFELWILYVR